MAANASPSATTFSSNRPVNTHSKNRRTVQAPANSSRRLSSKRPAQRQDGTCKRTWTRVRHVGVIASTPTRAAACRRVALLADGSTTPHRPAQRARPSAAPSVDIDGFTRRSRSSTTRRRNSTRYSASRPTRNRGDQKTKMKGIWQLLALRRRPAPPASPAGDATKPRRCQHRGGAGTAVKYAFAALGKPYVFAAAGLARSTVRLTQAAGSRR